MITEQEIENIRQNYIKILKPLFIPDDPISNDIVRYFASLLRICGMEDRGWDPYIESRSTLDDFNSILQFHFPEKIFSDENLAKWRINLFIYSHIVEMDAPYEVITNLLRFQNGKGYSSNPHYIFLNSNEKKENSPLTTIPTKKDRNH
ncbi:MAG: hypothetical protein OXF42_03560 [Candidatus Dadabacteria bacterium]|nr:hypothetical protein [Candidatus Dadabacteria bacterium]